MAAFSFQRATAALPSFLKRRSTDEAQRPPLRAVTDLGAPWAARMKAPTAAAPAAPPAAPRQESIVELLRRLERGLSERAEAKTTAPTVDGEDPAADRNEVDSALKTALDTLQRMARQPR